MSLRRTLLLALLAGALGGYIWLVEKPRMAAEGEPDELLAFETDKVTAVRLASPGSPPIALEKKEKDWRITEPIQADGDDDAVDRLLDQIAKTTATRRIPTKEAEPLATYGLEGDGTQARINLTLEGGTALPDVVVGNTTPVGYEAFARVEGRDEIVLVPLIVHTGVKKSVFDLREKKLFDVNPANAIAATIDGSSGPISLLREGDRWRITSPIDTPADAAQVETLVHSLNELTALAFYDGSEVEAQQTGLEQPTLTFEAEIGDKGTVGFALGAKNEETQPGYYLRRTSDGQIAKVPEFALTRFDKTVGALRDKRLFDCEAPDVAKITYERADGAAFALVLGDDGKWTMEPAPARALQEPVIARIRGGLAALAGNEVASESADTPEELAGFALEPPAVEVELSTKDGKSCGRALAGAVAPQSENPAYYLKRADSAVVMSAPAYLYSRMDMKADDFLAPPPASNDATKTAPATP